MKTFVLLIILTFTLIGCKRSSYYSSSPVYFIIRAIDQNTYQGERSIAGYKVIQIGTSKGDDIPHWVDIYYFTLSEGFNVGDTLILVKK